MIFCYPLLYFLMPGFFWKKKYGQFICLVLILWIAVASFRYAIFNYAYNPIMRGLEFYVNPVPMIFILSILQTISGPAFIGFIFIAVKFFKDWQQKQQDNFNLQKENANAELQLLKAQIHPHFLFNTLNNIYAFTINSLPPAKDIVKKLEDMLHYMIEGCEQPLVPVKNEIRILQDYFELERIRYGNSFDMQLEITGEYADKRIAPLLMIPFVENSFKHGTSKILRDPWIKLFIQADENILHFTLTNSKPATEIANEKGGIGLSNVKKRLELLYPANHFLTIESTTNTFTVNMRIPLQRMAETSQFATEIA
ncbi:MAG: histidine kinase [Chitinophagaceae bacterium]